jgi:hypothetical protein
MIVTALLPPFAHARYATTPPAMEETFAQTPRWLFNALCPPCVCSASCFPFVFALDGSELSISCQLTLTLALPQSNDFLLNLGFDRLSAPDSPLALGPPTQACLVVIQMSVPIPQEFSTFDVVPSGTPQR